MQSPHSPVRVVLSLSILHTEVTVTASRGMVEEIRKTAQIVNVKDRDQMTRRPLATIGNALEDTPGTLIQQSTYAQVSPFLRGLTGNQVLNLLDGVRFNNSVYRFGPNQYLALLEPSQVQRVEAMLGPTGSQYGSDALGGTINVITLPPRFNDKPGLALHGEFNHLEPAPMLQGNRLLLSVGNPWISWIVRATGRRHNALRSGEAADSHNVFHRFFGLTDAQTKELVGNQLQNTDFAQFGGHPELSFHLPSDQSLTLWYQHSEQSGVQGYKDLLGGQGQLQSSFEPQSLNFLYASTRSSTSGPWTRSPALFQSTPNATVPSDWACVRATDHERLHSSQLLWL